MYLLLAAILLFGPYRAELVRVVDGDTVRVHVHVWPGEYHEVAIRIGGIDTPELHAKTTCERQMAFRAKQFTEQFVTGKALRVLNIQPDKYNDRMVADLEAEGEDLKLALLKAGLARSYDGGAKPPWCQPVNFTPSQ